MQYSGYSKKFRYEFVDSALKVYKTRNEVDQEGERPLHRPKEWRKDERERLTFAMLTSSSREELDHFLASVNSFHPALKYTWKIYEIQSLFTTSKTQSMATVYQRVDSHSYLLHSSSHPSHDKNSIPFSPQFRRLQRLCSGDSDFSNKSEEMCHFFKNCDYPDSIINTAQHRAQQIDRQSALQTTQKEKNERIPFTFTYHIHITSQPNTSF